jgi:Spy/CpxP family protein refolding chaperone
MNATKILTTGALALTLSLSSLAFGATSADPAPATPAAEKGSDHKCGSGSCGSMKDDKKTDDAQKKADDAKKQGEEKGAPSSCGKNSCS